MSQEDDRRLTINSPKPPAKRTNVCVRLWRDDLDKLKCRLVAENQSLQFVFEKLMKAYIKENKEVMRYMRRFKEDKNLGKKRYSAITENEAESILRRLEEDSPLQDAFKEIDLENKKYEQ